MDKGTRTKIIGSISVLLAIIIVVLLIWRFSTIALYLVIASILTMLALPLKELLMRLKIGRLHLNNGLSSLLSLVTILAFFSVLFYLIFPPISKQLNSITAINADTFQTSLTDGLARIDDLLYHYSLISETESIETIVVETVTEKVKEIQLSAVFGNVIQFAANLFFGLFSVLFISFFFLKDVPGLQRVMVNMAPSRLQKETSHVLQRSQKHLSNYFVGVAIEMLLLGCLEFFLLSVFHVENALLIAVIGGILVVIPYVGSIIAAVLGCVFAVIGAYTAGVDFQAVDVLLRVLISFIIAKSLDSFVLQPYIASKSVKAHPLEIFLVVLVSGSLAGVGGMMLGIPAYTVIRIIAQEFFGQNNFVKTLTKSLKEETPDPKTD